MARAYHYCIEAIIPFKNALQHIEHNAKAAGFSHHFDKPEKRCIITCDSLKIVEYASHDKLDGIILKTVSPIPVNNNKITLASFLRYALLLFNGLYIEKLKAERIEAH